MSTKEFINKYFHEVMSINADNSLSLHPHAVVFYLQHGSEKYFSI
jgi:hypothetical protein